MTDHGVDEGAEQSAEERRARALNRSNADRIRVDYESGGVDGLYGIDTAVKTLLAEIVWLNTEMTEGGDGPWAAGFRSGYGQGRKDEVTRRMTAAQGDLAGVVLESEPDPRLDEMLTILRGLDDPAGAAARRRIRAAWPRGDDGAWLKELPEPCTSVSAEGTRCTLMLTPGDHGEGNDARHMGMNDRAEVVQWAMGNGQHEQSRNDFVTHMVDTGAGPMQMHVGPMADCSEGACAEWEPEHPYLNVERVPQTLGDAMRLIGRYTESEGGNSPETRQARANLFDAYETWCQLDRPETEAPALLIDRARSRIEEAEAERGLAVQRHLAYGDLHPMPGRVPPAATPADDPLAGCEPERIDHVDLGRLRELNRRGVVSDEELAEWEAKVEAGTAEVVEPTAVTVMVTWWAESGMPAWVPDRVVMRVAVWIARAQQLMATAREQFGYPSPDREGGTATLGSTPALVVMDEVADWTEADHDRVAATLADDEVKCAGCAGPGGIYGCDEHRPRRTITDRPQA